VVGEGVAGVLSELVDEGEAAAVVAGRTTEIAETGWM